MLPVRSSSWIGTATDIEDQKQLELASAPLGAGGHRDRHVAAEHRGGHPGRLQAGRSRPAGRSHQRDAGRHRRPVGRGVHRPDRRRAGARAVAAARGRLPARTRRRDGQRRGGEHSRAPRTRTACATGWPATTRCASTARSSASATSWSTSPNARRPRSSARVVMDNMAEGLYALDADGLVTYMNPAASSMLGLDRGRAARQADARRRSTSSGPTARRSRPRSAHSSRSAPQGRSIRILDDAFTRKDGIDLPRRLLLRAAAKRTDAPRGRRRLPRHHRGEEGAGGRSNESSTRSAGSDASATRSTRTGSSCTPSPSCRSPTDGPARSCCCA